MGWELTVLSLDNTGGRACPFQYEVVLSSGETQASRVLRGDGIVLDGGRVRFNRQADVVRSCEGLGIGSDDLLNQLAGAVADKVRNRTAIQA